MAQPSCIDLDAILWSWGLRQMSADHTLTSLDTSRVRVTQMSVAYQSAGGAEWYATRAAAADDAVFSNDDGGVTTWHYDETVEFPARAEWEILKGYDAPALSPKLLLEFPACVDGRRPLHVLFPAATPATRCAETLDRFEISRDVPVPAYASARAHVRVRTCRLARVLFTNDVHFSGTLTAVGERNRKHAGDAPLRVTAGIDEALKGNPTFFAVTDPVGGDDGDYSIGGGSGGGGDIYGGAVKKMAFRVEGVCTGEVAVSVDVDIANLETQV